MDRMHCDRCDAVIPIDESAAPLMATFAGKDVGILGRGDVRVTMVVTARLGELVAWEKADLCPGCRQEMLARFIGEVGGHDVKAMREAVLYVARRWLVDSALEEGWYDSVRAGFANLISAVGAKPDELLAEYLQPSPVISPEEPMPADSVPEAFDHEPAPAEGLEPDEAADVPTPAVEDEILF